MEYKVNISEIKAIIGGLERINPDWRFTAERTLELCKRMPELYVKANNEEKVQILKLLASNYTLDDVQEGSKSLFGVRFKSQAKPNCDKR